MRISQQAVQTVHDVRRDNILRRVQQYWLMQHEGKCLHMGGDYFTSDPTYRWRGNAKMVEFQKKRWLKAGVKTWAVRFSESDPNSRINLYLETLRENYTPPKG